VTKKHISIIHIHILGFGLSDLFYSGHPVLDWLALSGVSQVKSMRIATAIFSQVCVLINNVKALNAY